MKSLDELSKDIKVQISQAGKEAEEAHAGIIRATAQINSANETMIEADANQDSKAYVAAMNAKREAETLMGMYQKRAAKTANTPAITRSEYADLLTKLTQAADAELNNQNDRAAKLIDELHQIATEAEITINKAGELMHSAQYDLYKDQDHLTTANGKAITQPKRYQPQHSVAGFYRSNVRGSWLAKLAGNEDKQAAPKLWV